MSGHDFDAAEATRVAMQKMNEITIHVVPETACPGCGAYWGHPDESLNFPNRPKVDDHWKCYNPACEVAYYLEGEIVEYELPPEEKAAMHKRIAAEVDEMMKGKTFVRVDDGTRPGFEQWELR